MAVPNGPLKTMVTLGVQTERKHAHPHIPNEILPIHASEIVVMPPVRHFEVVFDRFKVGNVWT
jgi:hypothetical protein